MISSARILRTRTEVRALFRLALPIMIAQLAQAAMGFVDTVMAGQVGPADLAAVALGNSIWMPIYLLMGGILVATTAKVSERFGANELPEIGALVRQSLWLALALGLGLGLVLLSAEPVLQAMKVEEALIAPSMAYLQGIAFGFPALALFCVLRNCSDGMGRTRPSMLLGIGALLLNIPLNYIFIFGHLGIPAMGGVGCGWATGIVMWLMLFGMFGWVKWARAYQACQLFSQFQWPRWLDISSLLRLGVPIGVAIFAEASLFSVIALLIGALGATVVAGHQIALNISTMIFMIPFSLGMAVTVRVGHQLGARAPKDARFAAGVGIATALTYACFSATLMLLLRDQIAAIYTSDLQVIALASGLIAYAALFQFSDAIQVTAAGALRGYQDTRVTMIYTLFAYWMIGLPVGYSLGLTDWFGEPSGPQGMWQGLIVGLSCAAVLLSTRLVRTARGRIRLSERR